MPQAFSPVLENVRDVPPSENSKNNFPSLSPIWKDTNMTPSATRRTLLATAATLTLLSGLPAAASADTAEKAAPLVVGTERTFPPFEFNDSKTGELVGFEVDLVYAIGAKMGRPVKFAEYKFDAILPALLTGTIDMGAAGFAKTEERKKRVNFSDTFYYSGLSIIKRKGDTRINGIDDLKGKTISVQLGSISHDRAKQIPGAKVVTFDSGADAILNLITENSDAVINSRSSTDFMLVQRPSLASKMDRLEPINKSEMGMIIPKNNPELLAAVNKALAELKADGTYAALEKKWFGYNDPANGAK